MLVPKKGLEPPHPCGYMDLNHARLPIPPLRQWNAVESGPERLLIRKAGTSYFCKRLLACQTVR